MQFHRTLLLSLTLNCQVFVLIVRKGTSSQWWELKNFPMCVSKTLFQRCNLTRFSGATFSTTLDKRPGDCPCWFVDWLNLGDLISTSCRVNENSHLQPVFVSFFPPLSLYLATTFNGFMLLNKRIHAVASLAKFPVFPNHKKSQQTGFGNEIFFSGFQPIQRFKKFFVDTDEVENAKTGKFYPS